jgi:hypothetical protein
MAGSAAPSPAWRGELAATVAKWLLPSVSILFVVIGYVVVAAHRDLLGIGPEGYGASDYIAATPAFLQHSFTIFSDAVISAVTFDDIPRLAGLEILFIVALTSGAVALRVLDPAKSQWQSSVPQGVLAAAIVITLFSLYVLFDAPLVRIANVLINQESSDRDVIGGVPIEARLCPSRARGPLDGRINARACEIWTNMVCARVDEQVLDDEGPGVPKVHCTSDKEANKRRVKGEFIGLSIIFLLMLLVSVQAFRRAHGPVLVLVSVLAFAHVLFWPYAYGKLMKPTLREVGTVLFKESIAKEGGSVEQGSNETKEGSKDKEEGKEGNFVIINRDSATSKALIVKHSRCPPARDGSEVRGKEIRLWEITNTEILSVQEIYWDDVIGWSKRNIRSCPLTRL